MRGARHTVPAPEGGLLRHREWNIGVVQEPIQAFCRPGHRANIQWLPAVGGGRFLADPFAIVRGTQVFVLCEEFDYRSRQGIISAFTLDTSGAPPRATPAITPGVHTSYPFTFDFEGETYCVPETARAREIALYRALEVPARWVRVGPLVEDFGGVDNTIFEWDGRWWLMCTGIEDPDGALHLWHARSPLGPWVPHARNPVKRDPASARPAGTPFQHQGSLYRPSQDCSSTYGGRIAIGRVLALSPTEFREEHVTYVEPDVKGPFGQGVHTLSQAGRVTLIDGFRNTFIKEGFRNGLEERARQVRSFMSGLFHGA